MSEILAPAGGQSCALAAINAGADAIYLGLDRFSARSSAENFNLEKLVDLCGYAHLFGVKVYVALNTVVKNSELEDFLKSAAEVWNSGADAIIIQDIFLGKYLKESFPQIKLHLSTQAGTCNVYGARLAKEYGFDRVILARETKLADIKEISKIIETEAFIQGALCTCFSGQCYMSSFAGGNSGNRGRCKQPCRKLYSVNRNGFEEEAYRLSLSDLCVGEDINKLIDAGVTSFKIEGRMRRPEYVSASVSYYRNLLNGIRGDLNALKRTYNRGNYTKGLAFGQDKSFLSSAVQGHIGEFIGVIKVENGKYICQTLDKLSNGDGFKILRSGKEIGGGVYGGEAKSGFIINTRDRLKNGDKVFITTDTLLNKKLLEAKRTLPINISASFKAGCRAEIAINGYKFYGSSVLQSAQNRPLSIEEIKGCFKKTDTYPFSVEFGDIEADEVFLPKSELNSLRRSVFAEYYATHTASKNAKITADFNFYGVKTANNNKTAAICTSFKNLKADIGIFKPNDYFNDFQFLAEIFDGEKFLYLPPYLTGEEIEKVKSVAKKFDGIYCDSYYGLKLAKELDVKFFAGTGFNITNTLSLKLCVADYICISKELTEKEARELSTKNSFYLIAGNIKVMDLIYCPFEKKCASCDKRSIYTLTDSAGRKFPLRRYKTSECRFEVYNCSDLISKDISAGKLFDFSLCNENTVKVAQNAKELEKVFTNYTRGHSANGIE
ncbi:MAG: U32 family peptidase [Clostridia bacterium]|nr:U32 family peptidase [Clostridia bacterium]